MTTRTYTIARRENNPNVEPFKVNINGVVYVCRADMPEFALLDFTSSAGGIAADGDMNDPAYREEVAKGLRAMFDFIQSVFEPDSAARFIADGKTQGWQIDDVMPIIQDVIEEMTANPSKPPTDSPVGESSIGIVANGTGGEQEPTNDKAAMAAS
jgi:hypothetical protein